MDLTALPCGNAVAVLLSPPVGAATWRVLRNLDGVFVDQDDDVTRYDGAASDPLFFDWTGLDNGTEYFYAAWFHDGTAWMSDTAAASVTPTATYAAFGPDPQDILLERIDAGLRVEVARGTLVPATDAGIEVLRAFALMDESRLPQVTVELAGTEVTEHAIGDTYTGDPHEEAWLRRWTLAIAAWSLNPDERIRLRQALERVLMANLPLFYGLGLREISASWQDQFDELNYGAPMYTAICTFTCVALNGVTGTPAGLPSTIADVTTSPQMS